MEPQHFDTFARTFAAGLTRRTMLRRTARAALASPLGMAGITAARADGNDKDKKDKDKDRDKDRDQGQETSTITVTAPGGDASAAAQTVVGTNNQVCAGDCTQTSQQVVDTSINQAVLAGSPTSTLRPPTYLIDLSCAFDAPSYRTVCTGTSQGQEGAPLVQKIGLPRDSFCAVVLSAVSEPERRQTVSRPAPASGSNVASAGNGGVANADASGGSVTIGDVRGNNDIAIDASGGTANANAAGGSNNVAIAGGNQTTQEVIEQIVAPSTITVELEGNVVPGKLTTYWLDTEAGRRPAAGPTLVQVADQSTETGIITIDTWTCPTSQPDTSFDWFGKCTSPATTMQFSLYPEAGGTTPLATGSPDDQGRVRFANLPPGTYQVRPEGASWCHAESDHVDANGNVIVESQTESHVWTFVCSGGS
jgi:hypothetical protein